MSVFGEVLRQAFPDLTVQVGAPLAPLTTFKVGGPADWLVEPHDGDTIVRLLKLAHTHGVPITMLGGGSNVLVADAGVRGLVIRPRGGTMQTIDRDHV
ncbi:MAG TPA: FAD-binding protein, partial [Vicinamibacterales bacterium]|nr:FAD-binding protein [Vicinamibacterales bacterium]